MKIGGKDKLETEKDNFQPPTLNRANLEFNHF